MKNEANTQILTYILYLSLSPFLIILQRFLKKNKKSYLLKFLKQKGHRRNWSV